MKILLVDDSKLQRVTIQRILAKAGFEVTTAVDGEEGLRMTRQGQPHLVLLDMILPKLDGTMVLDQLKRDPATMHIPVIVLTGLSQRNEEKLKGAGAAGFYQKSELGVEKGADDLVALIRQVFRDFVKVKTVAAVPAPFPSN